ncbi:MAG: LytTR family DNA-binding domain-containing protein [Rikenellaceae bacterium]
MLKCIAIDDEPLALRQMKSYIERHPMLECVALFSDGFKAKELLDVEVIDLIFCDIEMPTINGIDFVESLTHRPMVIFTTAYSEYAIEGFRLEAIDYLLKPFSYSAFENSVARAINLYELRNTKFTGDVGEVIPSDESVDSSISVKSNHKVEIISIRDIVYIESVGEYIRIVLESGRSVVTFYRMKNIESELPSSGFARIHRCYIVNLDRVSSYDRTRVYIEESIDLPIGQSFREELHSRLSVKK